MNGYCGESGGIHMWVPRQTTMDAALRAAGAKFDDLDAVIDGAKYADDGAEARLFGDASGVTSVFDADYPRAIQAAAEGSGLLGFTNMHAMEETARNRILTSVASGGFRNTDVRPNLWVDAITDAGVTPVVGW